MRRYLAIRAEERLRLDGRLDKPFWRAAKWTEDFVDIQGEHLPKPRFRTRVKMLWDHEHLYIGAELEEPHVWATLTEHDSVIFHDNDFEVFIDPDGDNHLYAEFEMNALNTTWDLLLVKPYRDGGPAVDGFELQGIRTAVHVDGTLNDPRDVDRGWSVEIAIPWSAFKDIARRPCPPKEGDQWRINFSRVEWEVVVEGGTYRKVAGKAEDNWVWSPQGVIDMHQPEMWGVVQFGGTPRSLDGIKARQRLMAVYHAEKAYQRAHGGYATCLGQLDVDREGVELHSTSSQWEATFEGWRVDHESRLVPAPKQQV